MGRADVSEPEPPPAPHAGLWPFSRAARRRTYQLLDDGTDLRLGMVLRRAIIALILLSVAVSVLESVPEIRRSMHGLISVVEIAAVVVFTIEYLARLWSVVEHPPNRDLPAWRARLAYAVSPVAIIDLLAVAPFYLEMLDVIDIRALLVLRLLRFLKLTRYSPGMSSLVEAVQSERTALLTCLMFLVGVALISAALMHWAERLAQPDKFGTIPQALYWAVITLTTVGYGDVVPVTGLGRLIAAATAVTGLVMLALPVGILATAFSQVIQRRNFVVTWSMVARVPLFDGLPAGDIADIMRYLNSMSVEAGEVIVRKGEAADSMYFIAAGQVAVELPGSDVRLGEGQFFGEMAVLRRSRRTATVRAATRCKLLVLDASDLHSLMEHKPEIAEAVKRVARERSAPQAEKRKRAAKKPPAAGQERL